MFMSFVHVHLNVSVFFMFTCMNIWIRVCVDAFFVIAYVFAYVVIYVYVYHNVYIEVYEKFLFMCFVSVCEFGCFDHV